MYNTYSKNMFKKNIHPYGELLSLRSREMCVRCSLLTGDFKLLFLRRFGNVIKFVVSFRVTRRRHKHNMIIFFFVPEKFLLCRVVAVYTSIFRREYRVFPVHRPGKRRVPTFIVVALVFILPIAETSACSRRTYCFP